MQRPLRLLALDLGGESGRAMVGTFDGSRLEIEGAHRFANVPVCLGGTLHWDVLRLFGDILIVGGGSNNALLCQLTANASGLAVLAGPSEATALGNLIVQAIALGELASLAEARALVAASFPSRRYEPVGDWSAPRQRFEEMLRTRTPQGVLG